MFKPDDFEISRQISHMSTLVPRTNPNPTKSGSGSFGLRIRSVKGSEFLSPDPDPDPASAAVAKFPEQVRTKHFFSSN
jgi:hypothetical protein